MTTETEREEALRLAKEAGISNQTRDTIEPTIRLIRLVRAAAPAAPANYVMVPAEPTNAMLDAAEKLDWSNEDIRGNCCNQWQAMMAAAPKSPAVSAEPVAEWSDQLVQTIYKILCSDEEPPPIQHWEGFTARRIRDAVTAQLAAHGAEQFLAGQRSVLEGEPDHVLMLEHGEIPLYRLKEQKP